MLIVAGQNKYNHTFDLIDMTSCGTDFSRSSTCCFYL